MIEPRQPRGNVREGRSEAKILSNFRRVEAGGRRYAVYHRKTIGEPGWADREIVVKPLTWDPDGYPVIDSDD